MFCNLFAFYWQGAPALSLFQHEKSLLESNDKANIKRRPSTTGFIMARCTKRKHSATSII